MIMKKILFIVPLPPPVHGHSLMCKYVLESDFLCNGYEYDVVNLHTSRTMEEMGKKPVLKFFRFVKAYIRTLCLLIRHRYDFCYIAITCHGSGFLKDMPFALLCKVFCKKVVYHQHNQGVRFDMDRIPYKWLYPWVYKNSKVILLSWNLYSDISRYVPREHVYICPNGIPSVETHHYIKPNIRVPGILFLSNLLIEKGIFVLLDALNMLHANGVVFKCDIIGSETSEVDKSILQSYIIKKGLQDSVHYYGPAYGNDKEKFFNDADVFVLPSLNECFPLVLLEAMQHSIVCVASNEGAIPDIIRDGETGYIFEKGNASQLCERLQELCGNYTLLKEMGKAGYSYFEDQLTLKRFESNLCKIFSKIVNE